MHCNRYQNHLTNNLLSLARPLLLPIALFPKSYDLKASEGTAHPSVMALLCQIIFQKLLVSYQTYLLQNQPCKIVRFCHPFVVPLISQRRRFLECLPCFDFHHSIKMLSNKFCLRQWKCL